MKVTPKILYNFRRQISTTNFDFSQGGNFDLLRIVHSPSKPTILGDENETIRFYYLCISNVAGNLLRTRNHARAGGDGDACTPSTIPAGDEYSARSRADGDGSQPEAPRCVVRIRNLYQ